MGSDQNHIARKGLFVFILLSWPYFLNDFYHIPLTANPANVPVIWALDSFAYFVIPITTLLILYKKRYFTWRDAGFTGYTSLKDFGIILLITLCFYVVVTRGLGAWFHHNYEPLFILCGGYFIPQIGLHQVFLAIYAATVSAFLEEIIFRGLLIKTLKDYKLPLLLIYIISAATFSAIHWCSGDPKLIYTFLAGLVLCFLYLWRGRVLDAVIFHFLLNFMWASA
jgi:membrane protease YdiL (CAAX protease family)